MVRILSIVSVLLFISKASCKPIDLLFSAENLWSQKPENFSHHCFPTRLRMDFECLSFDTTR